MEFELIDECLEMDDLRVDPHAKIVERRTTSYGIPVFRKLIRDMESHGVPTNLVVGQLLPWLKVRVEFELKQEEGRTRIDKGILKINGLRTLVSSVMNCGGWEVKIRLNLVKIFASSSRRIMVAPHPTSSKYSLPVDQNGEGRDVIKRSLHLITETDQAKRLADIWLNMYNETFKIKCSLFLECRPIVGWDPDVPYQLAFTNKMLTEELFADMTIIAGNGSEMKAHRSVLASRGSVFAAMFQHGMKEATSGILELREMSEESVRALLEFLYIWKRKGPEENPLVCVELLEAGHKYDIPPMENFMRSILLKKPGDWFTLDAVLKLILFVKVGQFEDLQKKAVRLLKSMEKEVKSLPGFQNLCEENGKTDEELFYYLTTS